ncbi:hypothetical protein PYCC9005_004960 [Savitreella phatthalungensis]
MVLWQPTEKQIEATQVSDLRRTINKKHGLNLRNYDELLKYSVEKPQFWLDMSDHLGIRLQQRPTKVLNGEGMYPPPSWFPGAKLNYTENCLEGQDESRIAVVTAREGATDILRFTLGDLKARVYALANSLRAAGVQPGDRVAGIVCNSIHAITLAFATGAIGAVYSSTSPDMGTSGILDRLKQITPKVVFFDNASLYNGKRHDLRSKAKEVLTEVRGAQFVMLPNLADMPMDLEGTTTLDKFQQASSEKPFEYTYVDFGHPLFVMYSSGTTGPPKCIVHGHGGILLQMRKEYAYHLDMRKGDVFWQYTTTGWMMWQYCVTAVSHGVTVVLLDGSPMVDVPGLLRFIKTEGVTHFGTSPRWLSELKAKNIVPKETLQGSKLRVVTSTGSVLVPDLFHHFYAAWPKHIQLSSVSGGTDLMACFFIGSPVLPVYPGQLQCVALGMAARAYTSEGTICAPGEPGELVCDKPFPSQPIYFLSDPSGSKYKAAYYERYPGIWHHGDFVVFEKGSSGVTVLGRSDGVLNPSGVRFGSAEIYAVTERFAEIEDAICVGQRRPNDVDEQVLLFLIMRDKSLKGPRLPHEFEKKIKKAIREALSPRHVPRYVCLVDEIPLTINGKKVELVVKQIVSGATPKVSATIANKPCLDDYYRFREVEKVMGEDRAKL